MENALAPRIAPSARPAPANALAGLYFDPRYSEVASNPTPQFDPTMRGARDYAMDPRSVGNQIVVNMATSAAPVDVRGGARAVHGVRAFHASPHLFNRFDLSRIGTGEGAQAYGHGGYFAGNEDTALEYLRAFRERFNRGHMYEVNLRVDPTRLLDWDAPLSQQPQAVQDATREILHWQRGAREALDAHRSAYGEPAGRHVYSALEGLVPNNGGGAFAGNPQAGRFAAEELRDAGIPGLRYLDGGSRAAGEGSRNYVIFDDNLIEILRRYGLLGMLGGGAAAASGGKAEAAQ